jgi:LacI family transcriptional regulator
VNVHVVGSVIDHDWLRTAMRLTGGPVRRHPTIRDVATQAGVSVQTVSRVVNGKGEITEKTRQRVQGVIGELGYRPSAAARSLASRRTTNLGLVVHWAGGGLFQAAIYAAVEEASRHGYFFALAPFSVQPHEEPACVQMLLERRVEGLLFVGGRPLGDVELLRRLLDEGVPVVTIAWHLDDPRLEVVDVDNRDAGHRATEHLLAIGRRRIAQLVGPVGWNEADDRALGYNDAHAMAGLTPDPALTVRALDWGRPIHGYDPIRELLRRDLPFDALVTHNDTLALGAMHALREAGRRVPEDVAIVGFDDLQADYADPPLTSIRQPAREVGRLAARRLVELIGAPDQPRQVTELTTELIVRASSGAQ